MEVPLPRDMLLVKHGRILLRDWPMLLALLLAAEITAWSTAFDAHGREVVTTATIEADAPDKITIRTPRGTVRVIRVERGRTRVTVVGDTIVVEGE